MANSMSSSWPASARFSSPGEVVVDPCFYCVFVKARLLHGERTQPLVVPAQGHRRHSPFVFAKGTRQQPNGEPVMAVGEDMGLNVDTIAGDTLDGGRAPLNGGKDPVDDDPSPAITGLVHEQSPGFRCLRHMIHPVQSQCPCRIAAREELDTGKGLLMRQRRSRVLTAWAAKVLPGRLRRACWRGAWPIRSRPRAGSRLPRREPALRYCPRGP